MKKIVLAFVASSLFLAACNFSAGIDHDPKTGLTVKNSGLSYNSHVLTYNGVEAKTDDWGRGETLKLEFNDVKGFKIEQGVIYPGISIVIKDMNGVVKDSMADLLKEDTEHGIAPEKATRLSAAYTLGAALEIGREYELDIRIYDKKGKGTIDSKKKFKVTKQLLEDLTVRATGLSYKDVYFVGRNGRNKNEARIGDRIGLIVEGMKGFTEESGKIFPGADIAIYDKEGKEKYRSEDIFKSDEGADPAKAAEDISLFLTLKDEKLAGDESKWIFKIWDKKSNGTFEAEIMLKLK